MRKLVALVGVALGLLLLVPAAASASTPTLKSLAKTVAALKAKVTTQGMTITSLQATVTSQATTISTLQSNPVLTLSWLPTYLSRNTNAINGVSGPNVVFKGCNLQIKSATSESDTTGTGNLIVGWDDLPEGTLPVPFRSGSNNLVCGEGNNFTSYGGFVAGVNNNVSGPWGSVAGGVYNTASGNLCSVSGGYQNTASGNWSSVGGGDGNIASGSWSSVSGGYQNTASMTDSSVSGGNTLTESTTYGWAGGIYHTP
jgi:hypothetical protein